MSNTKEIKDLIGRDEVVDRIFSLVKNLKKGKNFCLALDGEWGSGKTFVMKMLEQQFSKPQGYVVVKYDAWANNFYGDPLIAILSCVLDGVDEKLYLVEEYKTKISKTAELVTKRVAKCSRVVTVLREIKEGVKEAIATFHNPIDTDKLEDFKSYQKLLRDTKAILNKITEIEEYRSKQTKLIILVDEIDRCLPDEQLKILERVHHLLDVKNCAVICALNKTSIAQTFKEIYGGDGKQYLRKFFDYAIHLGTKADVYINYLLNEDLPERLEKIFSVEEMKQKFDYIIGRKMLPCQVVDLACHYILQVVEKNNLQNVLSNREVSRYYDNLIAIIDEFGWRNLSGQYLFFIVLGLFVNKFINHRFFVQNKKSNPIDELKLHLNTVQQAYSADIIYEDECINSFRNTVLNMRRRENWQDHSYGEVADGNEFYKLGQLIIKYGGQDEYNEK